MAGLPKKYWKLHPGNLKKAWAAFRAEKGTKKSAPKKRKVAKKRTYKKTTKREPLIMAKAKRHSKARRVARRVVHHSRRAGRGIKSAMGTKPGQVVLMATTAAAGGVATSFAINNIPKVRDMSPMTKSLVQGGLGVAAIMFGGKRKWVKGLGAGAVIASIFGLSKSVLKLDPLAGPSSGSPTLSPAAMQKLLSGGRMSSPVRNVSMNRPAAVTMNRPASGVTMNESFPIPGWNSGRWGNGWG
jgi:hypothetical protein